MENLTIVDIARLTGVSVSTVSRVLNKHPDVSAKTRARVLATIEKYQYIPNNSARNLKRESMKAIVVIVKGFHNPLFAVMLGIIQQELERNNYNMIISQVDPNQDEVAAAISICKEKKPRGLIFMGGNFHHTHEKLARIDAPFVMLTITMESGIDRASFSSVTVDDYAAGYQVGQLACARGHRRIAVMAASADDISVSRLRVEGFLRSLKDNGLDHSGKLVLYAGNFSYQAGYEAANALLGGRGFTCLFCVSDILAFGAIRAIHDAGLAVPADISVIGFDGIEEGRFLIPSLATMKQPDREMAVESVRIILQHIRSGAVHEHRLFEAIFTEGESFSARKMDGVI